LKYFTQNSHFPSQQDYNHAPINKITAIYRPADRIPHLLMVTKYIIINPEVMHSLKVAADFHEPTLPDSSECRGKRLSALYRNEEKDNGKYSVMM
jgi:hypothetical protein